MSVSPSVDPSARTSSVDRAGSGGGWTAGRVVALIAGCILGLSSLGVLAVGGWATWMTNTQRDAAGYVTSDKHTISTAAPVISSPEVGELNNRGWWDGLVGTVRIRATSTDPSQGVFIGVAPTAALDQYLAGVNRTTVNGWFPVETSDVVAAGAVPSPPPNDSRIWAAHVSGSGTQVLTWSPASHTTVVVMRPDGSAGVSAAIDVGASAPDLVWVAVVGWTVGLLMLGAAVLLIVLPARSATRRK